MDDFTVFTRSYLREESHEEFFRNRRIEISHISTKSNERQKRERDRNEVLTVCESWRFPRMASACWSSSCLRKTNNLREKSKTTRLVVIDDRRRDTSSCYVHNSLICVTTSVISHTSFSSTLAELLLIITFWRFSRMSLPYFLIKMAILFSSLHSRRVSSSHPIVHHP